MNEDRAITENNHMNDNATENMSMKGGMKLGIGFTGCRAVRAATIAAFAAFAVSALAGPTAAAGNAVAKPMAKAAGREVVEKAAREAAERIAREGTEKVARDAAAKEVSRAAGERIVEAVAKPKVILAAGAGTAVVVGSHNVSKGARQAMEDFGEGVKDVAENHPEMLPEVLKEGGKPVTAAAHATSSLVLLVLALIALWFFLPVIRLGRARMAAKAAENARKGPHRTGVGLSMAQGDVVEAEYEMRG